MKHLTIQFSTKDIPFMTVRQLQTLRSDLWNATKQCDDAIGFICLHGTNPVITYAGEDKKTGEQ